MGTLPLVSLAVATQPHVGSLSGLGPALFYMIGMFCVLASIPLVYNTKLGDRIYEVGPMRGLAIVLTGVVVVAGAITAAILYFVGQ